MKKLFLLLLLGLFFPIKIKAQESVFIFGYDYINVPYKADINPYFDMVFNSIQLKPGYSDPNFEVSDENDGYFKHVINTHILKTYRLKYKAIAPKYYQQETKLIEFRIVDQEPPKVIYSKPVLHLLEGVKPNYLSYILVEDNETKTEDILIEVNDYNVDYQHIGQYEVIYTLIDNSQNRTIHIEYVEVLDKIRPTIESKPLDQHQLGYPFYIEDFIHVSDNYDPNPTITYVIEGRLDEVGYVLVTIKAVDQSLNEATLTKKIRIVDYIPPTLTLTEQVISIDVFSEPLDLSSYIGQIGKNLTVDDVIIEHNIDYESVGEYAAIYTLTDNYGNLTTKSLTVKVVDKTPPKIIINDLIIDINDIVDLEEGLRFEDNYSKKITYRIFETNFKQAPGTYYVIYEAVDDAGNHSYHQRIITVTGKTTAQNLYIIGAIIMGIALLSVGGFIWYKKRKTL